MACRLERSNNLRDSIIVESNAQRPRMSQSYPTTEDIMFMHILDYIGALSCIRADQRKKTFNKCNSKKEQASAALLSCKHRVFWQAVREIADREAALEDISDTKVETEKASALDFMLDCFPDDSKRFDGWQWLPLHLAWKSAYAFASPGN